MKKNILCISCIILTVILFILINRYENSSASLLNKEHIILQQVKLNANNINSWVLNNGIFNCDKRNNIQPGLEWPYGSGLFTVFSSGITIAAKTNGILRMAAASVTGEFAPGYIIDSAGIPKAKTDSRFKIYKVNITDYYGGGNPDYDNWVNMIPFGAPYNDINQNGIFDPSLDKPGIKNASQTIFLCMTDGFNETHTVNEGFGGGTLPLYAEVHLTAWAFNTSGLENVQYIKWEIVNKNNTQWTNTYFSIICDPDIGNLQDDYIGCDTNIQMGFGYNGDNDDVGNYGANPPAFGILLLERALNRNVTPNKDLEMSSFSYFINAGSAGPSCEKEPLGDVIGAYNLMKGIKKDETPWVLPPGGSANYKTLYCYSGDPMVGIGWNEGYPGIPSGSIQNCGGPNIYSGSLIFPNPPGNRKFIISSGAEDFTVIPGEKQAMAIAQFISRGTSNLHSVSKLKTESEVYRNHYLLSVSTINNEIPESFNLYQNYPNPFNPSTKIRFSLPLPSEGGAMNVSLKIYDIMGREITTLVNERLSPGEYEVEWNASNNPSGVYFYRLVGDGFSQTKKMVLVK